MLLASVFLHENLGHVASVLSQVAWHSLPLSSAGAARFLLSAWSAIPSASGRYENPFSCNLLHVASLGNVLVLELFDFGHFFSLTDVVSSDAAGFRLLFSVGSGSHYLSLSVSHVALFAASRCSKHRLKT